MSTLGRCGMLALAVTLVAGLGARPASGQTPPPSDVAKQFIGTWRLVSDTTTGIMIYDSFGNMAAQVMPNRARRKYAANEPTPEEAKDAVTGYLAYFGTYTIDERARTITHHRKGNINPGGVGDDVVRSYEFATADRLVLTPAGSTNKILWDRAR